jgi:hypothetical protein
MLAVVRLGSARSCKDQHNQLKWQVKQSIKDNSTIQVDNAPPEDRWHPATRNHADEANLIKMFLNLVH